MITLKGFRQVNHYLTSRIRSAQDKKLKARALMRGARVIVRRAKELVPVASGRLRRSITAVRSRHMERSAEVVISVGPARRVAWYGHIVEFGSVKYAPRPFLRPAIEEKEGEAFAVVAEELRKEGL